MDITVHDVITAASLIFGGGSGTIFILKAKNLVTFGKPTERREFKICECAKHKVMAKDIKLAADNIEKITTTLSDMNKSLISHLGYHKGRNGH